MMDLPPTLRTISSTCSLCHDQCVSACPVVETSHSQVAYPSRLATLASELARGSLDPDPGVLKAMQHCIHCFACMRSCVYLDEPVDVTPLVRWARQRLVENGQATSQMQDMQARTSSLGNPYGDVRAAFDELKGEFPQDPVPGGTLVIADAYQLAVDPLSAAASLRLLGRMGYPHLSLSDRTYTGWELWQYGYRSDLERIGEDLARELKRCRPGAIITLSPSSAYLLRSIFPDELGISFPCPVRTVPEAVFEMLMDAPEAPTTPNGMVMLATSCSEMRPGESRAAESVLRRLGCRCLDVQGQQADRGVGYPEGLCLDLNPDPRIVFSSRIAQIARTCKPQTIVCTSAFARQALQMETPGVPVADWAGFVSNLLVS